MRPSTAGDEIERPADVDLYIAEGIVVPGGCEEHENGEQWVADGVRNNPTDRAGSIGGDFFGQGEFTLAYHMSLKIDAGLYIRTAKVAERQKAQEYNSVLTSRDVGWLHTLMSKWGQAPGRAIQL